MGAVSKEKFGVAELRVEFNGATPDMEVQVEADKMTCATELCVRVNGMASNAELQDEVNRVGPQLRAPSQGHCCDLRSPPSRTT